MEHEPIGIGPSRCSACGRDDCPANDYQHDSSLAGWRLGLASIGLFLGPVVLAIAGAMCFDKSYGAQCLGALAGLGVGMSGPMLAARLRHRGDREST